MCRPSSCLWNSQCLSKHPETWDQWGASNDLSLLQGSSLSQRAMPEYPHRTNLICDWTGHRLCEQHHLSVKRSHAACEIWWEETKRRKRKKKEGRAKYIFNGKEAKGGYGKSSKQFPLSRALLYITLNCGTCKRQHYHLEAQSDCQFAIPFNNCHGPVRNYVSFNIGTEQKSTGRQTSHWDVVKAQNKLHARWITPRAITRRCFYAFHSFKFWLSNYIWFEVKGYDTDWKNTAQRKKSIKSLLNLIIAF